MRGRRAGARAGAEGRSCREERRKAAEAESGVGRAEREPRLGGQDGGRQGELGRQESRGEEGTGLGKERGTGSPGGGGSLSG